MISGKLKVTIKINELSQAKTLENNWQQFNIYCDRRIISVTVKSKVCHKLTDAASNYPQWVGAIAGKLDQESEHGLVLEEPNRQVFERKFKAEATPTPGGA